jgi:hypothetical protein
MTLVSPTEDDTALLAQLAEEDLVPSSLIRCGEATLTVAECAEVFNETIGPVVGFTVEE